MAAVELPESVHQSVVDYLKDLANRDADLARSPLAASALALARELDGENSATSKSMCAKALNETLAQMREMAPVEKPKDGVDELNARRAKKKRAQRSAATAD